MGETLLFTCGFCGAVNSVYRLNGSPKDWTCTGCEAVFRVSVESIKPPVRPGRIVKPEETIVGNS